LNAADTSAALEGALQVLITDLRREHQVREWLA
jgi:hypothetical protein